MWVIVRYKQGMYYNMCILAILLGNVSVSVMDTVMCYTLHCCWYRAAYLCIVTYSTLLAYNILQIWDYMAIT